MSTFGVNPKVEVEISPGRCVLVNRDDRQIVRIAIPAFAALIAEPLLLAADTAIIGHLGAVPLAGASAAHAIITALYGVCIFLAYSTTAAVSRHVGAEDERGALRLAMSGVWLGLLLGAVLGSLAALAARPLLAPVTSSPEAAEQAWLYFTISCAGFPGLFAILAATGALRGLLDLKTPLIVVLVTNVSNVIVSVTFVYGFGWGIAGAAVGSVIAQSLGAGYLVLVIVRHARRLDARLSPSAGEIASSAVDGAPLVVRSATLQAVLLTATFVAASMGDAELAAQRIAVTIVAILAFALDALAIAGQTMTGRYLGAADLPGVRRFTRRLLWWGFGSGTVAAATLVLLHGFVPGLFTSDTEVARVMIPALLMVAVIQPLSGLVFVLDGVLIGAGDAVYLAVAGTIVLACYLPLAWLVWSTGAGLMWLWLAYGGFIAARLATLGVRYRSDAWLVTGARR